jgi:fumarate hydratase class II
MPDELIGALALIKEEAARVNGALGLLSARGATAIANAAHSIREGKYRNQFPVDVFQTGSGTSTNMNMNEVIATLASTCGERIHPNDHVNLCQSSNDVIPTAIQLACALMLREKLLPSLLLLERVYRRKAREFSSVVKTARTHLMDAVPVTLGSEFSSYASLASQAHKRLGDAMGDLCVLPLGGTAAGTGLSAHPQFAPRVIRNLKRVTKLPLREASDHIAAQSCPLVLLSLASALKEAAVAVGKGASDIRLMGSGPVAGLREIRIPPLQAGSSIMPGKVNPVLCESVLQVAMEAVGTEATVHAALAQGSIFELNTALPITAHTLLSTMHHLANVVVLFAEKCVAGIKANTDLLAERAGRNPMLATALGAVIGYDRAAAIAEEAMGTGETILEVAKRRTRVPEKRLREILDLRNMLEGSQRGWLRHR